MNFLPSFFAFSIFSLVTFGALGAPAAFFMEPICPDAVYSVIEYHNNHLELPPEARDRVAECIHLLHQVPIEQLHQVPAQIWPALTGEQLREAVRHGVRLDWRRLLDYHMLFAPAHTRLDRNQILRIIKSLTDAADIELARQLISASAPPLVDRGARRRINLPIARPRLTNSRARRRLDFEDGANLPNIFFEVPLPDIYFEAPIPNN